MSTTAHQSSYMLDLIISELQDRYINHRALLLTFCAVWPTHCCTSDFRGLVDVLHRYEVALTLSAQQGMVSLPCGKIHGGMLMLKMPIHCYRSIGSAWSIFLIKCASHAAAFCDPVCVNSHCWAIVFNTSTTRNFFKKHNFWWHFWSSQWPCTSQYPQRRSSLSWTASNKIRRSQFALN